MVHFGFHLCNLTSDLCNGPLWFSPLQSDRNGAPLRYNGLVPDAKPFRLTESVKAAG
jgi:hypothetical protein